MKKIKFYIVLIPFALYTAEEQPTLTHSTPSPLYVVPYASTHVLPPVVVTTYTDVYGNLLPAASTYHYLPMVVYSARNYAPDLLPISSPKRPKHKKPLPRHNHTEDASTVSVEGYAFSLQPSCLWGTQKYPSRDELLKHDGFLLFATGNIHSQVSTAPLIKHLPDIAKFSSFIPDTFKLFLIERHSHDAHSVPTVRQVDISDEVKAQIALIARLPRGSLQRLIDSRKLGALLSERELKEMSLSFFSTQPDSATKDNQ